MKDKVYHELLGHVLKLLGEKNSFEMVADWWGITSVNQIELTQKLNQKYWIRV